MASTIEQGVNESETESTSSGNETRPSYIKRGSGRKRTRAQKTSCEACKTRKVKCDRAEPSCGWCARHSRECVYKERRNQHSRADQIVELELKVKRLDSLLHALGRRVEDHVMSDHINTTLPVPGFEDLGHERIISTRTSVATTDVRGCAISFGGYRLDSHPSQSHQMLPGMSNGEQSSMSSLSRLLRTINCRTSPLSTYTNGDVGSNVLNSVSNHIELPPHEILYTLVDLYFKHTNTWIPILDRKTTFGIYFGSTSFSEADGVVLYAIVASTLRFCHTTRLSQEMKDHYHECARRKVVLYATEHVDIEAVRALVILLVDILGTSNMPRACTLLALAIQTSKQLRLFTENRVFLNTAESGISQTRSPRMVTLAEPHSFIEDEGRRRLAWSIYQLDRYGTIATSSLDFMLEDRDMRRHLPCSYDLFSRNSPVETCECPSWQEQHSRGLGATEMQFRACGENLGSFSYHCQILRILSGIHEFLKTPVDITSIAAVHIWKSTYRALDDTLNGWLQSLPGEYSRISSLCHSDPASRVANWFMLHSAFVTSVVRLHSAAAYSTLSVMREMPESPAEHGTGLGLAHNFHAMQRCLTAVDSLCDIIRDVQEVNGLDLLGVPFAFSLWMAARLLLVHAAAQDSAVDPKVDFLTETLAHIGQYWEIAGHYATILTRVVTLGREGSTSFRMMRKIAYDIIALNLSTRRSGLERTETRPVSLNELDYIDVFEFFNVPKALGLRENNLLSRLDVGSADGNRDVRGPNAAWLVY